MIVKNGVLVYPLRQKRVYAGADLVYDRDTRGKSWFILDLSIPGAAFVPAGSSGLITADGKQFCTHSLPFAPAESSGLMTADGMQFWSQTRPG